MAQRIINFRGKSIISDEWLYGNFYDDGGEIYILPTNLLGIDDYEKFQVDPDTVGQYTGIIDKTGNGIYEGDIVECVSWNEYFSKPKTGEVMQPFRRRMYVDFRKGAFKMVESMPAPMKDNEWDIIYNGDLEIVGNRYDNYELLNKGLC